MESEYIRDKRVIDERFQGLKEDLQEVRKDVRSGQALLMQELKDIERRQSERAEKIHARVDTLSRHVGATESRISAVEASQITRPELQKSLSIFFVFMFGLIGAFLAIVEFVLK